MITKLAPNSEQILKSRYYVDDKEDWPSLCKRVVESIVPVSCAKYEYTEKEINTFTKAVFGMINELYFLPNSPTLFNAGTDYPMLSACFIINVDDDLISIYESVKESAIIHKMGGGVGFSLSKLRRRGSQIGTTHGVSSGAVSFLRVFSHASNEITAGGRRKGANMCMLDVDHGDILEFLTCKDKEGALSNFNLSITVPDSFMVAVINDEEIGLKDPKDGSIVENVKAKAILQKIARGAWRNGEPGLCFIDAVNKDNPTPHLDKIRSSNPCQPGWATVLTKDGIKTLNDIKIGSVIWSGQKWTKVTNKIKSGVKDVYAYKTKTGVFFGTTKHKIVQNGIKVEVDKATNIDASIGPVDLSKHVDKNSVMQGLIFGTGIYHNFIEDVLKYENCTLSSYLEEVPVEFFGGDHTKVRGFLRGLYSIGGVIENNTVVLRLSKDSIVKDIQLMLSSVGIKSLVTGLNIIIEGYKNICTFNDSIGFIYSDLTNKIELLCDELKCTVVDENSFKIVEKKYISTEEVYDITVDVQEHTYWSGGLLVSNCGEFYSIPYNSCNLGSLNLVKYVKNSKLDFDLLKKHIFYAVEYLDCIIDANKYPLEKIEKVTKLTRPIGLGIMGFADMLILLGVKYDSREGIALGKKIAEFISYWSLMASVELAKKRGKYPEFKAVNHMYTRQKDNGSLDWNKLIKLISEYGLRNSHAMVIAPTGTLARIANERSFGIEPIFAKEYESNILDTTQKTRHPLYHEFVEGRLDVPEEVFVTAGDIHWKKHIDMQAVWQLFTHNGISKTINMPEGTTEQDVLDAYLYAHKKGLKGITVYVTGSRQAEVLVSSERAKKAGRKPKDIDMSVLSKLIEQGMTANDLSDIFDCSISTIRRRVKELKLTAEIMPDKISRPDELWGPKYRIPSPSGNVYVEIGVDAETGKPLETIVNISRSGSSENAMAEALGKMISKALQHRMDPYEVIETIKDIIGGDTVGWWRGKAIKSVPDAIAIGLGTYMDMYYEKNTVPVKNPGSTVILNGGSCPNCGEYMLKSEGCEICPSCSYGKCS